MLRSPLIQKSISSHSMMYFALLSLSFEVNLAQVPAGWPSSVPIPTQPPLVTVPAGVDPNSPLIPPLPTLVIPPGWPGQPVPSVWPPPIPGVSTTVSVPTDIPGVSNSWPPPIPSNNIPVWSSHHISSTTGIFNPQPVTSALPLPTLPAVVPTMIPGPQVASSSLAGLMPPRPSIFGSNDTVAPSRSPAVVVMADPLLESKTASLGLGPILGIVLGVLAVILAVLAFVFIRRRGSVTSSILAGYDPEAPLDQAKEATLRNGHSGDDYSYSGPDAISAVVVSQSQSSFGSGDLRKGGSSLSSHSSQPHEEDPFRQQHNNKSVPGFGGTLARMTVLTNLIKRVSQLGTATNGNDSSPETPTPNGIRISRPPSMFFSFGSGANSNASNTSVVNPPQAAVTRDAVRSGIADTVSNTSTSSAPVKPKKHNSVTFSLSNEPSLAPIPETSSTHLLKPKPANEKRPSPLSRKPVVSFSDEKEPQKENAFSSLDLAGSLLDGMKLDFELKDFEVASISISGEEKNPPLATNDNQNQENEEDDDDKPLGTLTVATKESRNSKITVSDESSNETSGSHSSSKMYRGSKTSSGSLSSAFSLPHITDSDGRPFSFLSSPQKIPGANDIKKNVRDSTGESSIARSSATFPTPPLTLASMDSILSSSMSDSSSPEVNPRFSLSNTTKPPKRQQSILMREKRLELLSPAMINSPTPSHITSPPISSPDEPTARLENPGDSSYTVTPSVDAVDPSPVMYMYPDNRVPYRYSSNF